MNVLPVSCFSAPAAGLTLLPRGPVLQLPCGLVRVFEEGRVIAHGHWVIAVGIACDLFLVLDTGSPRQVPLVVREQLVGYLSACGAKVFRLRIRFPVAWHDAGDFSRTIVYWTRRFVGTLTISLEARLDVQRPRLALPIGDLARHARGEWSWVDAIWQSIEDEHPDALSALLGLLWEISRRWEFRWALTLGDAERYDFIAPEERAAIEQSDRTWIILVRRYLDPHGYELLPDTAARLL